jgi:hypothetical protein
VLQPAQNKVKKKNNDCFDLATHYTHLPLLRNGKQEALLSFGLGDCHLIIITFALLLVSDFGINRE